MGNPKRELDSINYLISKEESQCSVSKWPVLFFMENILEK